MVSWNAHRILGDLLCSFHSSEIDRLIDFDKSHDPSRYNVDALEEVDIYVRSRFGDRSIVFYSAPRRAQRKKIDLEERS